MSDDRSLGVKSVLKVVWISAGFSVEKINEMPVVNGICELAQIVKLLVPSAYW